MRHFWRGFEKTGSQPTTFKKHVIVLYWSPESRSAPTLEDGVKKLSLRYPSVKVKVVNIKKDPLKPMRHQVRKFPTVLLLKDGREIDRLESQSTTILDELFRKANV